jgi:hypothetical protein
MSSVTSFTRQIPVSTTYYSADEVVANYSTKIFEFLPSSSNYVGNYPNGFNDPTGGAVTLASAALRNAIIGYAVLNGATVDGAGLPTSAGRLTLRDLGKTIFAPVVSGDASFPGTATATSSWGYFRQVQLIAPAGITQGPGFMGGVTGSTFGVTGAANTPDIYTDYFTFYIPVSVSGVAGCTSAGVGVNAKAFVMAGGQM